MTYLPELCKDENGDPFIQLGENILRLEREEIDGFYVEKAAKELRETPENVEQELQELRKLIEEEEDLNLPDDFEFLVKFLRPCKFYSESAMKIIKKFYKFRLKHPKYTSDLTPQSVEPVYVDEVVYFLPKRSPDGARTMVLNVGNKWNTKEVSITLLIRALLIALEIAMGEPKTQVGGVHIILDMDGFSINHLCQLSPGIAKFILTLIQECLPLRLNGLHVINQPSIFNLAYSIFKPFIGERLKKRLYFHGTNWDMLKEMITPECLPERWGGCIKSPDCPGRLLYDVIHHYEELYELLSTYGYTKVKEAEN